MVIMAYICYGFSALCAWNIFASILERQKLFVVLNAGLAVMYILAARIVMEGWV